MGATQGSFDDLGRPLSDITFVVVDLETTGGSPASAEITEIGAVKVRGGQVLGTFGTLVRPRSPIPPFIAALTGITDSLVATAPRIDDVLPTFIEFAQLHETVLVAHNAPFDVGFLKAAFSADQRSWPAPPVLDTARLARTVLHRDEAPNCKLATLARIFRAEVTPTHRALDDARATVDVLHGLLERAANLGAMTWEDLSAITSRVSKAQRTKRHLAAGLPAAPGVYIFKDPSGRALYVGTSKNVRARGRTYFTASEQRRRMAEMIRIADRVDAIVCATALEAHVREIRLIVDEQPAYNRRSRRPQSQAWIKLTAEAYPRLSLVSQPRADLDDGACYLGPYPSRAMATTAMEALLAAIPLRTCTARLPRTPKAGTRPCVQAELGRCSAPCTPQGNTDDYALTVARMREAMQGDMRFVAQANLERIEALAAQGRFEEAASWRDRLSHVLFGSMRAARTRMIAQVAELVAAQPNSDNSWQIHLIRYGRLAGAVCVPAGIDPLPAVEALRLTGEYVEPTHSIHGAALTEETNVILQWLDSDGTRLVECSDALAMPLHIGATLAERLSSARASAHAAYTWSRSDTARPHGPIERDFVSRLLTA